MREQLEIQFQEQLHFKMLFRIEPWRQEHFACNAKAVLNSDDSF